MTQEDWNNLKQVQYVLYELADGLADEELQDKVELADTLLRNTLDSIKANIKE